MTNFRILILSSIRRLSDLTLFWTITLYVLIFLAGLWNIDRRVRVRGIALLANDFSFKSIVTLPANPRSVFYETTRPLPANHRVSDADFSPPNNSSSTPPLWRPNRNELVGKYLSVALRAKEPIDPHELLIEPKLSIPVGWIPLLVKLTNSFTVQAVDVDSIVDLKGSLIPSNNKECTTLSNVTVLAIMGDARTNGMITVAVPSNQMFAASRLRDPIELIPK